jgi:hypothetical protein
MSCFLIWLIFLCAALLLEWNSHRVFLWHSHVSLHMAQCHWGVTHNNKVIFCCFLCRTIFRETSESNALLLLSCPQWWVQKVQEQVELISTTMSYLVIRTTLFAGMHLRPCLSLRKPSSFCMLVWMPWMLTNGRWAKPGAVFCWLPVLISFLHSSGG